MPLTPPPSERLLRLTLCDPQSRARELELDFRIFDTPIAHRWSEVVVFLSERAGHLYNPERFYHFANDPKGTDEWLHGEIERCIDGVNRHAPGFVDIRPTAALEQNVMNELHERFAHGVEDLQQGETIARLWRSEESIGALLGLAKDAEGLGEVRERFRAHTGLELEGLTFDGMLDALDDHPDAGLLIQMLTTSFEPASPYLTDMNVAIHRWEDLGTIRRCIADGQETWKYFSLNYYPGRCIKMRDEDYQYFTIQDVFGRVYLEDMTAGKCIWDVYRDQDDVIIDEHYKTLDYYWGDVRFYFGPSHDDAFTEERMRGFWEWFDADEERLNKIGFHRDDPKMTIGTLPVADLEPRGALAGLDAKEIVARIGQHQRMLRACIVDEDGETIRESRFLDRFGGWKSTLRTFGADADGAGDFE